MIKALNANYCKLKKTNDKLSSKEINEQHDILIGAGLDGYVLYPLRIQT
jgi:hypothetical protein